MTRQAMKILVDSREQSPFLFQGSYYKNIVIERAALPTGDYSLAGLADKIAVERKELGDLIQCLGRERERFERELQRAGALDCFVVVIEGSWQDMAQGLYRGKFNPHADCQSIAAFMARYQIPFMFAGTRPAAEYVAWSVLRQYLEGAKKRWQTIVKEHDVA